MPSKRIMILTNRVPYPLNDGGNMATHAMIKGYKQNGWEVFLLSMNTSRHKVEEDTLSEIYQDIEFKTVAVNNEVKPIATLINYLFSSKPNHLVRFSNRNYEQALQRALEDFQPDIVQIESVYLSTYLPIVNKCTSAKTVLRVHNIEHQIWSRLAKATYGKFKRSYLNNLARRIEVFERDAWEKYELLLPITDFDADHIKRSGNAKVYTVPFGVEIANKEEPVIEKWVGYHIGAMDWLPNKEGIEWFLQETIHVIKHSIPEFEFYFAGRNMPEKIEGDELDGVYNMGEVPIADAFIEDKKILIVPIRSGGGIRVKILEAMAAGKVIISTDVGMQGIDAIPDSHYLRANTASDFLLAISWCLTNKGQAQEIAAAAQKLVLDKYDQINIAEGLSEKVLDICLHQES